MAPTFSIIIPAHNEEHYIGRTLLSLLQQTFNDYEIIVVANGCNDKTPGIVSLFEDSRIKLYSLREAHVSKARNFGAKQASGKYFFFLDADTTLSPKALEEVQRQFAPRHSIATIYTKADQKKLKYSLVVNTKNIIHRYGLYHGCSGVLICRRHDFFGCGGYNRKLKVREHRDLIKKLDHYGNFTCIIDAKAKTSMRRYQQWGLTKAAVFWTAQLLKGRFENLYNVEYEKIR